MERARGVIDTALNTSEALPGRVWRYLDAVIGSDPIVSNTGCVIEVEASGTRLDINRASPEELTRLFDALGRSNAEALADAIVDWRDNDDEPLPNGAESQWYAAQRRPLPRNGPFADDLELMRVRGFEDGIAQRYLSVEPGVTSIPTASGPVLASIPGFTDEAVSAVLAARVDGIDIEDLRALASTLSSAARDSIVSRYQDISRLSTLDPEAWILRATGRSGLPFVTASVELRLVRTNRRATVVRRTVRT